MKVLSYNLYGIKNTEEPILKWELRQKNIEKILNKVLKDIDIKICCFQEVNENNINLLEKILSNNSFIVLEKFPMKTESLNQYNIVATRSDIDMDFVYCLPHGKDKEYQNIELQKIDYDMSDYRTTVFAKFSYDNKSFLVGNIHTDYISTEGKIKGILKSLDYLDIIEADYKLIIGDMNMVSHMSEVYNILKVNNNYQVLSRSKDFDITDNSWHGYGTKEQVNVDFAFIEKDKENHYEYKIMKQDNMIDEGSDHRPVIIEIS